LLDNGVYFCRSRNFEEAEKWLSISISLLSYFESKELFEEQIMLTYNSTLKNIPQSNLQMKIGAY
jgi:hypothetical protein